MPRSSATQTRKRWTLIACILGTAVVTIDSTVVNVALPAIERDLGGGLAGQQWTSNAYLLTLGALLLVGGSLGDIYGERKVFALGVAGFGLTSVVCAIAPTIGVLITGRALQGATAALLTPASLAVIVATFEEEERGRAVGLWTAWGGIGVVLGPLLGGQLVDAASWRWVFAVNVPVILVTLALIARFVPARDGGRAGRVDVPGAALCAAGLAGLSLGLIEQPLRGWEDPLVAGGLVAGVVCLASFVAYEARAPAPMLPLTLFRDRNFAAGNLETFAMYGGLGLVFFFLVIFLQQVAGYSALKAGSTAVPVSVVMMLLSTRFGALADRLGPRLFMSTGPLVAATGIALLLRVDEHPAFGADLLPALIVFGLGLSMTVAPLTATVLASADEHNAGIASGVNNAIARVAGLLAIAAVGAVVAAQYGKTVDERLGALGRRPDVAPAIADAKRRPLARVVPQQAPPAVRARVSRATTEASLHAFHLGMGIAASLVAAGGLLGAAGIRNPRRRVSASRCPGGQLVAQPVEAARARPVTGAAA